MITTTRTLRHLALAGGLLALAACGDDGGGGEGAGGAGSARGVVEAHVAASKRYDLAGACELLVPARRAEMAAFDGAEVDGYCTTATEEIVANATPEARDRTKGIYTGAEIAPVEREGGTWFRVEAADESYHEDIRVVEVDGRWWIAEVEGEVDDHGH
ncbi:MAG TPA: hypothetical protein VHK88_15245 [Aquihabitans sp.]|nr:hypothetical protein [Aquihabitans sp.]